MMVRGASAWAALVAAMALAAVTAAGAVTVTQPATLAPAGIVPVTLSSTYGAIPAPLTAASLTGIGVNPVTPVTALTVVHGTSSWSVQLAVTAKAGFTPIADSVVFTLAGPTSPALTITSSGPALPAVTSAVALGTASDITVTARGVCTLTCTITAELRFVPTSGAVPAFALPVTLSIT